MKARSLGMIIFGMFVFFSSTTNLVFAQESLSWKSEYLVGILDSERDALIPVIVTTFSKDSLKLEWEKPEISKTQKIIGYEILRKDINFDYQSVVEISNPKKTSYIDMNLEQGYYGYKVVPVLQKMKSDKITMHGIDRTHYLFPMYVEGQQLLAQYSLNQNCLRCSDESFEEIDNIFQYEFPEENKRTKNKYQLNLESETLRTKNLFDLIFKIRNNY